MLYRQKKYTLPLASITENYRYDFNFLQEELPFDTQFLTSEPDTQIN